MSQDYPVSGPDSGDPRNPNQQNETLEPIEPIESIEPIEPLSAGYVGMPFRTPNMSSEQQSGEIDTEEQTFSSAPTSEAELPPEAQGEVNGGPLGCCLGLTIGLVLSLTLVVFGRLYLANPLAATLHNPLLVLILLRVVVTILAIVAAILCGYFGWKLGKRFFREYEPPVVPVKPPRQKQRRRRAKTSPKEA